MFLVVGAIGVGTAAYEAGNILGGAAGLATITGIDSTVWGVVMGSSPDSCSTLGATS